jgi:hypothetical protein
MSWDAHHRRGEVLRTVLDHLEREGGGALPLHVPGVAATFGDELTLLGALSLRWHTRLAGALERRLAEDPSDPELAVVEGWCDAAQGTPGLRGTLDAYTEQPASAEMAAMVATSRRKERSLLAAMAGLAGPSDPQAEVAGRRLELEARARHRSAPLGVAAPVTEGTGRPAHRRGRWSLLHRVKAVLAA